MSATLLTSSPSIPTLGELLRQLGDVPADRVRYFPLPGTATERDVLEIQAHEDRLCELVDGVLVEKTMGLYESLLAGVLLTELNNFVRPRRLGIVSGADGMMRLLGRQIRIPDVAYVSRERLPGRKAPREPVPDLSPDLAVEVLSSSNTPGEMKRKRAEYFASGTRLVWMVDSTPRSVAVYTPVDAETPLVLAGDAVLTGGDVLPGFSLALPTLFAVLDEL